MTLSSAPPSPPTIGSLFSASPVPSGKPVNNGSGIPPFASPTQAAWLPPPLLPYAALRLLHRSKTAAPPSAGNSLLCLPRSPPDLGVSFVMAPHLTRPALELVTLPLALGMTSFFAVPYSLVSPATTLLSWLHSRSKYAANHSVDLLQPLPSQSRPPAFLFVDNLYAINTGTGRWRAKSNLDRSWCCRLPQILPTYLARPDRYCRSLGTWSLPHLWEWNCRRARQTWCWWDYLFLDAWCSHPHWSSPPMQSSAISLDSYFSPLYVYFCELPLMIFVQSLLCFFFLFPFHFSLLSGTGTPVPRCLRRHICCPKPGRGHHAGLIAARWLLHPTSSRANGYWATGKKCRWWGPGVKLALRQFSVFMRRLDP